MIFERRAYTFEPGKIDDFWQAQVDWNTPRVFGPILNQTIGYFRTLTGPANQIVHLYRFDGLEHWQSIYARYYVTQVPEYFALVRTMMLQQENAFLAEPPIARLHAPWTEGALRLPAVLAPRTALDDYCLVETTTSFFPGGLPAYWKAVEAHRGFGRDPVGPNLMVELVSMIGRLHRVFRYEAYATPAEAHAAALARRSDPAWQAFIAAHAEWIAAEETLLLEPTPLPSRRFLSAQAAS